MQKKVKFFPFFITLFLFTTNLFSQPKISSFAPASGPIGTSVTISGSNFSSTAINDIVYFGAVKAIVSSASTTSLTIKVPPGATFQPISITANGLTGYSNNPFIVTYSGGGTITPTSFSSVVVGDSGYPPTYTALADFDGDGKVDQITAYSFFTTGLVLANKNNSSIGNISLPGAGSLSATGTNPVSIAVGDIDGDGKPDFVTANQGSNTISVLKNTSVAGTISFASNIDFPTGTSPQGIAIGDIDGDGKPDIVVVNSGSNTISILMNTSTNGNISFSPKLDFATGASPQNVFIGDIDADGKPDIVVTNNGSGTVSVFRNMSTTGTISLQSKSDYNTGSNPYGVFLADIDGDGKPDLTVSNTGSNTVSIFQNTSTAGAISFASKMDFATGNAPKSLSISDMDGDGKPDLVVSNFSDNTISVIKNSGNNSINFAAKVDYNIGASAAQSIAIGDLDGDGKPDIATEQFNISILRNQTNEPSIFSFSPAAATTGTTVTITGTNLTGATSVSIGGKPATSFTVVSSTSITAVVGVGAIPGSIIITTLYGTGTLGGFSPFPTPVINSFSPISGAPGSMVTITGSNFSATPSNNTVYFGGIKAAISTATTTSLTVTIPIGAAYQPITVTTNNLTAYSNAKFSSTFTGGGYQFIPGDFANEKNYSTNNSASSNVSVADFDGDGKLDIVAPDNINEDIVVYRNTGAPGNLSLAPKTKILSGYRAYPYITLVTTAAGDLDGDGKPDVVALDQSSDLISILRNNSSIGTISFAPRVDIATGHSPNSVAILDIDGDGKPDIVVEDRNGAFISVYRNTSSVGVISFAPKIDYITGPAPNGFSMTDIDGDGKPDLIVANYNGISILKNTSTSGMISFAVKVDFITGTGGGYSVSTGDLDGDGKDDIVVASPSAQTISIFRNISTTGNIALATKIDLSTAGSSSVTINDLNGDGKPDIIIDENGFSIFRNTSVTGSISFAAKVNYTIPVGVSSIADIDGDGKPDIISLGGALALTRNRGIEPVITSFTPFSGPSGTTITITGNNFTGATAVTIGGISAQSYSVVSPTSITAVVNTGASLGNITITNQYGTATIDGFSPFPSPVINSVTPLSNEAGVSITINGSNFDASPTNNIVYFGAVRATVTAASTTNLTVKVPNGTTYTPISVTTNNLTAYADSKFVLTFPRGGTAFTASSFAPKVDFINGAAADLNPSNITLIDLNDDGKSDMLVTHPNGTISIYKNTSKSGTVSYAKNVDFIGGGPSNTIAVGDLDGDGKPDIAVANSGYYTFSVFRNTSTQDSISFAPKIDFNGGATSIAINDIDGDGKPDVIVTQGDVPNSTISIFRNTSTVGNISFDQPINLISGFGTGYLSVADLDGDSKPDIVTVNEGNPLTNQYYSISVLKNTSTVRNISFNPKTDYPTGAFPIFVAVGDLDGDGKPDLALANTGTDSVAIYKNTSINGVISFGPSLEYLTGNRPYNVVISDLDGDGKPDLAVSNSNSNSFSILKNTGNNGTIAFAAKVDYTTGSSPKGLYVGDIDGDGVPDVVVANNASNSISVFQRVLQPLNLPTHNFTISTTSATCKGAADGSINIIATQNLNYTATLTGSGLNQSDQFTVTDTVKNLAGGSYQVCITIQGQPDYQQCYALTIAEPKDLSVYSTVNDIDNTLTLSLNNGTSYIIQLNGNSYTTANNSITLPLKDGSNQLSITTDKLCQGTYQTVIDLLKKIVPFPDPFDNLLSINLGNEPVSNALFEVHNTANGKVLYSKQMTNQSGVVQLDLGQLREGVYALYIKLDNIQRIYKIVKK